MIYIHDNANTSATICCCGKFRSSNTKTQRNGYFKCCCLSCRHTYIEPTDSILFNNVICYSISLFIYIAFFSVIIYYLNTCTTFFGCYQNYQTNGLFLRNITTIDKTTNYNNMEINYYNIQYMFYVNNYTVSCFELTDITNPNYLPQLYNYSQNYIVYIMNDNKNGKLICNTTQIYNHHNDSYTILLFFGGLFCPMFLVGLISAICIGIYEGKVWEYKCCNNTIEYDNITELNNPTIQLV